MYAKLFERRRGVQSAYDGGGEQSAYDGGGGGGGGGGGAVGKFTLINSSLTCTHSLLKHKKHHGKRVHSAPALSCSTASLTFVRTTELSGLLSMAQHVICKSLSSGRGGGAAKATRGRHFIRDGGGGRPPQGYAGSGAESLYILSLVGLRRHVHVTRTPAYPVTSRLTEPPNSERRRSSATNFDTASPSF